MNEIEYGINELHKARKSKLNSEYGKFITKKMKKYTMSDKVFLISVILLYELFFVVCTLATR